VTSVVRLAMLCVVTTLTHWGLMNVIQTL